MPKIIVHRLTDLPSCIAVAVGDPVGNGQRFNLQPTPITRRLYTIHVAGPHEPGVHVVQIHALGGDTLRSHPIEIPYGMENGIINADIVGPVFGEFFVDVVKVADVPKPQPRVELVLDTAEAEPDAPSESPTEATQ